MCRVAYRNILSKKPPLGKTKRTNRTYTRHNISVSVYRASNKHISHHVCFLRVLASFKQMKSITRISRRVVRRAENKQLSYLIRLLGFWWALCVCWTVLGMTLMIIIMMMMGGGEATQKNLSFVYRGWVEEEEGCV